MLISFLFYRLFTPLNLNLAITFIVMLSLTPVYAMHSEEQEDYYAFCKTGAVSGQSISEEDLATAQSVFEKMKFKDLRTFLISCGVQTRIVDLKKIRETHDQHERLKEKKSNLKALSLQLEKKKARLEQEIQILKSQIENIHERQDEEIASMKERFSGSSILERSYDEYHLAKGKLKELLANLKREEQLMAKMISAEKTGTTTSAIGRGQTVLEDLPWTEEERKDIDWHIQKLQEVVRSRKENCTLVAQKKLLIKQQQAEVQEYLLRLEEELSTKRLELERKKAATIQAQLEESIKVFKKSTSGIANLRFFLRELQRSLESSQRYSSEIMDEVDAIHDTLANLLFSKDTRMTASDGPSHEGSSAGERELPIFHKTGTFSSADIDPYALLKTEDVIRAITHSDLAELLEKSGATVSSINFAKVKETDRGNTRLEEELSNLQIEHKRLEKGAAQLQHKIEILQTVKANLEREHDEKRTLIKKRLAAERAFERDIQYQELNKEALRELKLKLEENLRLMAEMTQKKTSLKLICSTIDRHKHMLSQVSWTPDKRSSMEASIKQLEEKKFLLEKNLALIHGEAEKAEKKLLEAKEHLTQLERTFFPERPAEEIKQKASIYAQLETAAHIFTDPTERTSALYDATLLFLTEVQRFGVDRQRISSEIDRTESLSSSALGTLIVNKKRELRELKK